MGSPSCYVRAAPALLDILQHLQQAYSVVMQNYTHKTHTGITKKQFFSIVKANTKAA